MKHSMRRSMKDWEKIVDMQQDSGLSAKRFCEEKSIGLASFYKWRGRFQKDNQLTDKHHLSNGFVEVGAMGSSHSCTPENNWRVFLDLGDIRLTLERG